MLRAVAQELLAFTLALQATLGRGNLICSPLGLRAALEILRAGAGGETADELSRALQAPAPWARALAALDAHLRPFDRDGAILRLTHALWVHASVPLLPRFREVVEEEYLGDLMTLDSSSGPPVEARINRWVTTATRGRITELVQAGALTPDTGLLLTNAVYFKGAWRTAFDRSATLIEPFHLDGGDHVPVPLMRQTEVIPYMEAPGFQAVLLPYRGSGLGMLILLPRRWDGLRDFEQTLTVQLLEDCLQKLRLQEVNIVLPRFRVTWNADLRGALSALGVQRAFDSKRADFSGINGCPAGRRGALSFSTVLHGAFVAVDEMGTEAAAATVGVLTVLSRELVAPPPPITFRADHPFLFLVWHRESGVPVFAGRCATPRADGPER